MNATLSITRPCLTLLLTLSFLVNNVASASALTDLQTALETLKGEQPLSASLNVTTWRKEGKGKNAVEKEGMAGVQLRDDAEGLQVLYSKNLLDLMESEAQEKEEDKTKNTPILNAIEEFKTTELHSIMSSSNSLLRSINKANFINTEENEYKGQKARALYFKIPIETLEKRDRKYIKKFNHHLTIWINDEGYPIASQRHINVRGRAFIVIKFKSEINTEEEYIIKGDRLVTIRKSYQSSGSGGGEESESRILKQLELY